MKKSVFYFIALFVLFTIKAQCQDPPYILQMEDYVVDSDPKGPSNQVVSNGRDFTPSGVIKIPIVFAGFYCPTYADNGYLEVWPNTDTAHKSVPIYAINSDSLVQ